MAIKKTEIYSLLWSACDELRGGMDASQYKDYVLTLLFIKYVSDKYGRDDNGILIVPEGTNFDDLVALKNDKEIGDKINKIIAKLAEENELKKVIDIADFNDDGKLGKGKEMVQRLSNLVAIFQDLDFRANSAEGDDLLGDAYEYLMRHFATESGKSKGQFYTPAEVSQVVAKVVGVNANTKQDETVYDPTCGSGSLLLKVANEAPNSLTIYGQEMDNSTAGLAKMNMILHDQPTAEIYNGNTLSYPEWKKADGSLETFDFAVANPPFSYKSWTNGVNVESDEFNRFEYGIPPAKNGDYAFLLHVLKSLKSKGKAAIILPHGVLFRGNAEANIRQKLLAQGYIKGIIGLPPNLFYGTGIPACIIVIDKAEAATRDRLFMVDASKGFIKDGNKNRLRSQDVRKIVDVFNNRIELPRYSRTVSLEEIAAKDYNLNIPRYIDSSEPEDIQDLEAHLKGGIPNGDIDALEGYWRVFPKLRGALFCEGDRPGYCQCRVEAGKVKATILNHEEFKRFKEETLAIYRHWCEDFRPDMEAVGREDGPKEKPKEFIERLSEGLLEHFAEVELLDKYDVYQHLMDYWGETMQDDVDLLMQDGCSVGKNLRELVVKKGEKLRETPDLLINKKKYKADLIPPGLIVGRYFADKQQALDELQGYLDGATQELEAFIEEHGGEDGALSAAQSDAGNVTKTSVKDAIKKSQRFKVDGGDLVIDESDLSILQECLELFDKKKAFEDKVKKAREVLDKAVLGRYPKLAVEEIMTLVIEDKWLGSLERAISTEGDRLTQQLANRVKVLEERYAETLPELELEVEELTNKVEEHLRRMGLSW